MIHLVQLEIEKLLSTGSFSDNKAEAAITKDILINICKLIEKIPHKGYSNLEETQKLLKLKESGKIIDSKGEPLKLHLNTILGFDCLSCDFRVGKVPRGFRSIDNRWSGGNSDTLESSVFINHIQSFIVTKETYQRIIHSSVNESINKKEIYIEMEGYKNYD